MRTIKDFLIAMCEVENIKAKELQQLTGKSQSVVYEWLNSSNITNFPTYESLSKILCRLGLTMDEFLKCKSDKLVDYSKFRTYNNYLCSKNVDEFSLSEKRITFSRTVMEALNYENILNCYINDCLELKKMITLYLKGIKVDTDKFDLLCNNIKPFVISDIEFFDEVGGVGYYLNSSNIYDFKIRTEAYKERVEDDPDYALECNHKIIFPDADYFALTVATENLKVLEKYLLILDEKEKNSLMYSYLICIYNKGDFDKNNSIFKFLYRNKCKFEYCKSDEINELYKKILNKVKGSKN